MRALLGVTGLALVLGGAACTFKGQSMMGNGAHPPRAGLVWQSEVGDRGDDPGTPGCILRHNGQDCSDAGGAAAFDRCKDGDLLVELVGNGCSEWRTETHEVSCAEYCLPQGGEGRCVSAPLAACSLDPAQGVGRCVCQPAAP